MNSALLRVTSSALRSLADSINSGRLAPPFNAISLQRYLPQWECSPVAEELHSFSSATSNSPGLAHLLYVLADAKAEFEKASSKIELVWSGPEMPGAASRDTSVVVRELFSAADLSVLVAGFSISHGSEIFSSLAQRMIQIPNLRVRMFLNVAREDDRTSNEELLHSFYLLFKSKHCPWPNLPQVFYDPRALETAFSRRASLHAKCLVVDGAKCFVSSANFTQSGQARNIEVGVLIEDTNLATSLHDQFELLITHGLLRPIPGLA